MFYPSWIELAVLGGIPAITAGCRAVRHRDNPGSAIEMGFTSTLGTAIVLAIISFIALVVLDIVRDAPALEVGKYVIGPLLVGIAVCFAGLGPAIGVYALLSRKRINQHPTLHREVESDNPYQSPNV